MRINFYNPMEFPVMRVNMKNNLYVAVIVLIALGPWQTLNGQTQDVAEVQGVIADLLVSDRTVLPFQSVGVVLVVRNEESRAITTRKAQWWPFLYLSGTSSEEAKWKQYVPMREPLGSPPPLAVLSLSPGGEKVWKLHLDYNALQQDSHVFAIPGQQWIKGQVGYLESSPIKVDIQRPQGVDAEAYSALTQSDLHKYLSWHTANKFPYDHTSVQKLEEFIARYNGSQYAKLAKFGLAAMWVQGVEGKTDLTRAASLLHEIATSSDETLAARAYFFLGQLTEQQGDRIDAEHYYDKALRFKIDPYFNYLAKEAQIRIEQQK
jgi:hypothetical protein